MKIYNRVLTIAGSDSGGGAGIQADIKTISAFGCYCATAVTAVTVQNTLGVSAVHAIPVDIIRGQIAAVMEDLGADVIKIGMLHSADVVGVVCDAIDRYGPGHVVLDPVMVSTSGHRLIEEGALDLLMRELIPRSTIITPNIPEAEILLGGSSIHTQDMLEGAALDLARLFGTSVLLKAGHLDGAANDLLTDILVDSTFSTHTFSSPRLSTRNTHGTGCTLSAAVAASLAQGRSIYDAVFSAKGFLTAALASGADYEIGGGHGPVNHLFQILSE